MSSSKDSIDMEAYPILRIDELSNASDEILDRSLKDLPRLVEKMEYEDRKNLVKKENPLVKYARKQFEAMEEEVTKRNALKRVERMLQGTEEIKPKSYDNILTSRKAARPRSSARRPTSAAATSRCSTAATSPRRSPARPRRCSARSSRPRRKAARPRPFFFRPETRVDDDPPRRRTFLWPANFNL